jgi:purine-nucleoside phosphorylase
MEPAGLEYSKVEEAAAFIQKRIPFQPKTGIILGTGQADWLKHIEPVWEMSYSEIPHLLSPAVITHEGKLYAAYLEHVPVLIFSGRVHYYEGYSPQELARPVRLLHLLGVSHLIIAHR